MNLKERNGNLKDFFDRKADGYDDVHVKFAVSKASLTKVLPDGVKRILDLGGGTGMELVPFFERFPQAEAVVIDLSKNMLEQIGTRPFADRVKCICGDFFESDFGSGYDAVISSSALHHFSEEDKERLYKKVYASLKPGGLFVNADKFAETQAEQDEWMERWENEPDCMAHIDTPITIENETRALEKAGFDEITWEYIPSDDYSLVVAKK